MSGEQKNPEPVPETGNYRKVPKTIPAQDIFQGEKEIWIEHAGCRYRLRITRKNRLILQK